MLRGCVWGARCWGGRAQAEAGAVVPEVWAVCHLILLRVVAEVAAAARITGFFLVLLDFRLAGRRLLLAAEVLGVLIHVARPGSSKAKEEEEKKKKKKAAAAAVPSKRAP